jgi:hypothetical protein
MTKDEPDADTWRRLFACLTGAAAGISPKRLALYFEQPALAETDCVAENGVRSETVSRRVSLQFAICREIFRNCRESRFDSVQLLNDTNAL